MQVLLFITICGFIAVSVGLFGLYVSATRRLDELEAGINKDRDEITRHKRDINRLRDRETAKADKVVIVHEYNDESGLSFPNKEGL